jgi:hypothetical protein
MNKSIFDDLGMLEEGDITAQDIAMGISYVLIIDKENDDVVASLDQYSLVTGAKLFEDSQFEMLAVEMLQVVSRAAPDRKFIIEVKNNKQADPQGE